MSKPLVSILIITYNQKDFIHEALTSALNQDYDNIEIVVADDGSTDGTDEIILDYARKFPKKVVPLVGGPRLGITGNSNRGLRACKGKYVAFMGGDDIFLPGKISRQVAWLEADQNRVLCYHDMDVFSSETGETLYYWSEKYRFRNGNAKTVIRYGTFFGTPSVMIRYPHGLLFNENIPVASDWFMWIEVLERQSGVLGYVDGVYVRYRRHANNITLKKDYRLRDALATIDAIKVLAPNKYEWICRQKKADIFFIEAYNELLSRRYGAAFSLLVQSLRSCYGIWLFPIRLIVIKLLRLKY